MNTNYLREIRESLMISKTELARKANISSITLTRIEKGKPSRIETQRTKIILALGLKILIKTKFFIKLKSIANYQRALPLPVILAGVFLRLH